jgi:hypothetical protein
LGLTVDALYGRPFVTTEIPIEASDDWIELLPRYRIRNTGIEQDDNVCRFTLQEEVRDVNRYIDHPLDPNAGDWDETAPASWHDFARPWWGDSGKPTDFDVITNIRIVNTQGQVVANTLVSYGSWELGAGMLKITRSFVVFDCAATGDLRLHFTIAMDPYEVPILLTLTDIAIPGL